MDDAGKPVKLEKLALLVENIPAVETKNKLVMIVDH